MEPTSPKIVAYLIRPSPAYVDKNLEYDAEPIPGQNAEQFANISAEPVEFEIPNQPILFQGLLSTLRQTDYPVTTGETYPLVSKRIVEILESVGLFPHQVIPVRILDMSTTRYLNGDFHVQTGQNLKPDDYTDDYVLLHLTSHLDVMDLERSEYEDYDAETNLIMFIDKFVFKNTAQELPPIFRLINTPVDLFISEAAKKALEAAGVKSLWLTRYGDTEVENIFWE
jgi:hypothetical protein